MNYGNKKYFYTTLLYLCSNLPFLPIVFKFWHILFIENRKRDRKRNFSWITKVFIIYYKHLYQISVHAIGQLSNYTSFAGMAIHSPPSTILKISNPTRAKFFHHGWAKFQESNSSKKNTKCSWFKPETVTCRYMNCSIVILSSSTGLLSGHQYSYLNILNEVLVKAVELNWMCNKFQSFFNASWISLR